MPRFTELPAAVQRDRIDARIRTYFDGCNEADVEKIAAQFAPDAVHYFPPGLGGPWVGRETIARHWRELVLTIGSAWSIETMIVEAESLRAVIEWTHWKTRLGGVLRGDEWYRIEPEQGLITEIRAFYAAGPDGRDEVALEGFDYAARRYHLAPPVARPHPDAEYAARPSVP